MIRIVLIHPDGTTQAWKKDTSDWGEITALENDPKYMMISHSLMRMGYKIRYEEVENG